MKVPKVSGLDLLLERMDRMQDFLVDNRSNGNGFQLGNHQLIPTFEAVDNGLRRFILAYATGAGKTVIPIEIVKHLMQKRARQLEQKSAGLLTEELIPEQKVLVLAPKQALNSNWNQPMLDEYGCKLVWQRIEDKGSAMIHPTATFVTVNYEKLEDRLSYLDQIIRYASEATLVIADEVHRVKNYRGKRAAGYRRIIDASQESRFIGTSASPCPDRMVDLGMLLYAIDPKRWKHYGDIGYNVQQDSVSLWELREKGQIRFFSRDLVAEFHNLPSLTIHEPIQVGMLLEDQNEYFDVYMDNFDMGTLGHSLERISLEAMMNSPDTAHILSEYIKRGYVLNFFSHLRKSGKGRREDLGIFAQLERLVKACGANRVEQIHGDASDQKHILDVQKRLAEGSIDVLINQWSCTAEGFSEVTGDRPVAIIPLRSPFTPGLYEQMIGRSFRPGQYAAVEYLELHPTSKNLLQRIENAVVAYAKSIEKEIKTNWTPSLLHTAAYNIRKSKEEIFKLLLYLRSHKHFVADNGPAKDANIDSTSAYARGLTRSRILDMGDRDKGEFGSGARAVAGYVGQDYDRGLRGDAEALGNDYYRDDILLFTPGKINVIIAKQIERIKKERGDVSWRVAELGSCTPSVFAQASILIRELEGTTANDVVCIDGAAGFARNAKQYLSGRKWVDTIYRMQIGYSSSELETIVRNIKDSNFMDTVSFRTANFVYDSLGGSYDAVVASQCLQYNNQSSNRDIEKAVININSALRTGGYLFLALTGNDFNKSFTTDTDEQNIVNILEAYGFAIEFREHAEGVSGKQVVLKPCRYIWAVKIGDASGLYDFDVIPRVYTFYREYLTGGKKLQRFYTMPPKKERPTSPIPDILKTKDGQEFYV